MKALKRWILCLLIVVQTMGAFKPVEVLAKEHVKERFNQSGSSVRKKLKPAKDSKEEKKDVTQPWRTLPQKSKTSVLIDQSLNKDDETRKSVKDKTGEGKKVLKNGKGKQQRFQMEAEVMTSVLPSVLSQAEPIRIRRGETIIEYVPLFYDFKPAVANDNMVVYQTDKRNTEFCYYLTETAFEEKITLFAPQEAYAFHFQLEIQRGKLIEDENKLFVVDERGKRMLEFKAPIVIDAVGEALTDLSLSLTTNEDRYYIELEVDPEWMNSDQRVYPVIIDPQFSGITNQNDTTIREQSPQTSYAYAPQVAIGHDGIGRNRAFFKVNTDLLTQLYSEATTINEATLSLFMPNAYQWHEQGLQVCALSQSLDFDTATWDDAHQIEAVCQSIQPQIDTRLKYFENYFDRVVEMPINIDPRYRVSDQIPELGMQQEDLYKLFDGDPTTGVFSDNGIFQPVQEIIIDLDRFIRPEEVRIQFGGLADSSHETLTLHFINTETNESIEELVSNGMSAIEEDGTYDITMQFVPTTALYNRAILRIDSQQPYGKPRINEFQITRYQLEEHYLQVDLRDYLQDMVDQQRPNNGFYLRLENEADTVIQCVSQDGTSHQPQLGVDYATRYDVSLNYALEDITLNVRPAVQAAETNVSFESVTFDGIARPGSEVILYFKEFDALDDIVQGEQIGDVTTSYLENSTSNYQSQHVFEKNDLKPNGVYQVSVKALQNGQTSQQVSETFMIAYLSYYSSLADLAFFYGVSASTLRKDNQISGPLSEHSVIFVRNPKRNLGVAYTSAALDYIKETQMSDYLLGKRPDSVYYTDRVNVNTGNYHLAHTDMTYGMFGESVSITRIYNSKNSMSLRQFGKNWDYNFNFMLIAYDENKMVFKKEDGQRIYFEKIDDRYQAMNNDSHTMQLQGECYLIQGKDRSYHFDMDGKIQKLQFHDGQEITYYYDQNERLERIALQNKNELHLSYEQNGLIESIRYVCVNQDKRTIVQQIHYGYDVNDRLIQVVDPLGYVMT